MKRTLSIALLLALSAGNLLAQTEEGSITSFRKPAPEIEALTMAAPLPSTYYNGSMTRILLAYSQCKSVPLAELAANEARIGGLRINTENFSLNREALADRLQIVDVKTGTTIEVGGVPTKAKMRHFAWAPSGNVFAFTNTTDDRVDLYVVDASVPQPMARKVSAMRVNATLGTPFMFLSDTEIIYKSVPAANVKTPTQKVAGANVIQENLGKRKSIRTYEDLMTGPFDEVLYDYCCTSVLAIWDGNSTRMIGEPSLWRSLDPSPDGRYIIAETEHKPYSYIETHRSFPSRQFIMDLDGNVVKMLNDGTRKEDDKAGKAADKKDEKKAPKPSGFAWRSDLPATLTWSESVAGGFGPGAMAPQGGDAAKDKKEKEPEKTHQSKVYQCGAPFNFETDKTVVLDPEFRMGRIMWSNEKFAVYTETSTDQKVRKTIAFVPCDTLAKHVVLFEESTEYDSLGVFPVIGSLYTVKNRYGRNVVWTDAKNSTVLLSGTSRRDAEGWKYSFLDKLTVKDGKIVNMWNEKGDTKQTLIGVTDYSKKMKLLLTKEAFGVVPDYYELDLAKGSERKISSIENSVPQLTDLYTKQIVEYTRKDGLKCFGSLYLPKGYDKERDGRLPVFMWTYPYEYQTPLEAERSRPDRYKYLKPTYGSAQIWASQGYAVLDEFTMAIVAEHKDSLANNVFLEQLVMSAESAVDFVVDSLGIGDRDRIGIGGHSYGGFMTANLLAHTRLFRAGVARSGAYLRSLTPFGFQSERRNYWQAKDVYDKMSPFNYADKIKDALMIIHGMMDDNMGTFPVQSERLYSAIVYNGGTARYVQLPYEAHSYAGIETTLDMLHETGAWMDKYVKNAEPRKKPEAKTAQVQPDWKNIDYVGDGQKGHMMDIYLPKDGKDTHKVIMLIYGSAWFSNDSKVDAFKTLGKPLTDAGFAVVSINHRASTEYRFPAQINDVKAAIRFVRANAEQYKLDTSFVGITGYSSGGHLSALAGVTNGVKTVTSGNVKMDIEGELGKYCSYSSDVDAVVDWFGPIDMSRMDNNCTTPKDDKSPEAVLLGVDPRVSPDHVALLSTPFYIDETDPKFIVIHGTADDVVPYGQGVIFSEELRKVGILDEFVTVKEGGHGPITMNEDTFRIMTSFFLKEAALKNLR